MWEIQVSSAAETDIAELALWYEAARGGLGEEFVSEITAAFDNIQDDPQRFRLHYPAENVRRVLAKRFPCHIYFYLENSTIKIFAVVHAARHECEWKRRM